MFKKLLSAAGIAAVFVFGSAAAAAADEYPATAPVVASDTTLTPGQSVTITVNDLGDYESVLFSANGGTLASIVAAAGSGTSVEKTVVNGSASATFTAPSTAGTYVVTVTAPGGEVLGSVTLTVAAAGGGSGGGLPATGGSVPAAMIWAGVGALGLGGIAVAAVAARRRAAASN
ncbi:hypothetical protein K0817_016340 [Microbacterium sp. HD4P20]|uniref:hypothetical protein n=1 Tax=Microbacterium sp. HD4P20 TaxID=2864874 RepID=UPI001C64266B|nr:hypothetical protein [Microbacterium sp. HD4P20]MCP2638123.1 hypothetical protein [Microbacterium sp. HD4P20]